MTKKEKIEKVMGFAMANRPTVGGFPYLAECLRLAGVTHNLWSLPSAQSIYMIDGGWVVNQGTPLVTGLVEVPTFDQEALITALRTNQEGNSTFPEFLAAAWQAGVVGYDVEFPRRTVTYMGRNAEMYIEEYPAVEVVGLEF
jgi:uncharacterized protein YbcV (DUF1398 family)